jgi:hypothetical protein
LSLVRTAFIEVLLFGCLFFCLLCRDCKMADMLLPRVGLTSATAQEFFGFGRPWVVRYLESLPGAERLMGYERRFDERGRMRDDFELRMS